MPWISHLLTLINAEVVARSQIALGKTASHQQIKILKRGVKRIKIEDSDRVLGVSARIEIAKALHPVDSKLSPTRNRPVSTKSSRAHPNLKTKYRVANWPSYEASLLQRGNINIWMSPEAIEN